MLLTPLNVGLLVGLFIGMLGLAVLHWRLLVAVKILRRREAFQRTFFSNMPFLAWLKDPEGHFLAVNEQLARSAGVDSIEALIGKTDLDIWPLELAQQYRRDDEAVMAAHSHTQVEELLADQGVQTWFETYKTAVLDEKGQVLGTAGFTRNISDRKRTEADLQMTASRLQLAARAGGLGVWEFDVSSGELIWDEQMYSMYGLSRAVVLNGLARLFQVIHPEDLDRVRTEFQEALQGEWSFDTEFRILYDPQQAGEAETGIRYMRALATVLRSADGKVERMVGVNWDITRDRQREIKLQESENALAKERSLLRTVIDNLPDAIFAKNAEGRKVLVNRADVNNVGKPEAEVLGMTDWDQFPPEVASQFRADDLAVMESGQPLLNREERLVNTAGKARWMHTSKVPWRDQDGHVIGIVGIGRDITDRKEIEVALARSQHNFNTFFDTIEDLLFVLDMQGNMLHVNQTVCRRLEYSENELVGQSVLMVHPPEQREEAASIVAEMVAGQNKVCLVPVMTRSGNLIPVETRVVPGEWNGAPALFGVTKDISVLRKSEEKFSRAFHSGAVLMAISTIADGCYLDVNDAFLSGLGYSRQEVIGKTSNELNFFVDPSDRMRILTQVEQMGRVQNIELRVRARDGSVRIGLFSADPIQVDDKSCWLTTMTDITERKRAEEGLTYREAFERELMQLSTDLVNLSLSEMDATFFRVLERVGQFCRVDRSYIFLLNPAQSTMSNTHEWCAEGIQPEINNLQDLPCSLLPMWMYHLRNSECIHIPVVTELTDEWRVEREILEAQAIRSVLVVPLMYAFSLLGFVGFDSVRVQRTWEEDEINLLRVLADMLAGAIKRMHAEQELRESETRFRSLFEKSPVAYQSLDETGCFIDVNTELCSLLGYSREELLGTSFGSYWSPATRDYFPEKFLDFVRTGSVRAELQLARKDQTSITVLLAGRIQRDADGRFIRTHCILNNITDRKEMEMALLQARDQAEAANQAKSEFLANMSHEIRTPMNGVIGMTGLLLDTELSPEQRQYAEIVRSSGEALLSLLNDILDFSKIEARKLSLEVLDFNLRPLIEDVAEMLALNAHKKDLELVALVDAGVPEYLRGDPGRLRQVIVNLGGNAVKFTHHGEVVIRVSLVNETDERVKLRFSVADTGIGIPVDKQDRLFTPFMQVDGSMTRKYGGTGLGLAISRQLVEMMAGQIGMESQAGQGSTFWFTAEFEKQPGWLVKSMETAVGFNRDLRCLRVLVVDDNATNRLLATTLLNSWGCRCAEAVDSRSALAALYQAVEQSDPFQVALLDMNLPDLDGESLAQQIKSTAALQSTALIMLSSLGGRSEGTRLEKSMIGSYLTKPIRQSQLLECLRSALRVLDSSASLPQPQPLPPVVSELPSHRVRILLAEDNPTNQMVTLKLLEKLGYRADAVANGLEVLIALQNLPYDLVLMDCQMPEMDGFEATRSIRTRQLPVLNPTLPIIALTAYALKGDRERCIEAGMDDYISKPVQAAELAAAIQRQLARFSPVKNAALSAGTEAEERDGNGDLESLAIFNRVDFIQRMMDDENLAHSVLANFLQDIPHRFQMLRESLAKGAGKEALIEAHTIKGACATVSAGLLSQVALEIENACRSQDLIHAADRLPVLEERYAEFVRQVRWLGWT